MDKNKIFCLFLLVILISVIYFVGIKDICTHGFFADEIDLQHLSEEDLKDRIDLSKEFEVTFSRVELQKFLFP